MNIAPIDAEMYNFSNPKRVGPGVWYMLMLKAAHAETKADRLGVCSDLRLFCDWFGCGECKGHCATYIRKNNPEDYIETVRTLFDYIVRFMNAVNYRLKKPGYDKDYLFLMLTVNEFKPCEKDCDKKKPEQKKSNVVDERKEIIKTPSRTTNIRTLYLHNIEGKK